MAHRVLRAMIANSLFEHPVTPGEPDLARGAAVARKAAEAGIVLLKNDGGRLPLEGVRRIAVIGGRADLGVLSRGGSSQVIPKGSARFDPPPGAPPWGQGVVYHPDPPLAAIRERAANVAVSFDDGSEPARAAEAARAADVAIVFAGQWATEAMDTSLELPDGQDALIAAVAAAQPSTVVVLQTGNPVLMPWLDQVQAVVEAWYPGSQGGEAIAAVLFGEANPSGRLPITFPAAAADLPHPELPGADLPPVTPRGDPEPFEVDYHEGADVGYRWFARTGAKPLFPFGFGLSYTRFAYRGLEVEGGETLRIGLEVANTGERAGTEVVQLYLEAAPGRDQQRLLGWARVSLEPGEARRVAITAEPRLLADWDIAGHGFRIAGGDYRVFVGPDAATAALRGTAKVDARDRGA
jgi:beta-glucosidase